MKVLIYSIYSPKMIDGVSSSTRSLVAELEHKGIDITVCTTDNGWTKQEVLSQRSEKLRIFKSFPPRGADISPSLFLYFGNNLDKYDVIQFDGTFNLPTSFGSYIAKARKIPYVIRPQGNLIPSKMMSNHIRNSRGKYLYFVLFAKRALTNASKIICTSQLEKEETQKHICKDKIVCIGNGFNYQEYLTNINRDFIKERLDFPQGKKYILYLGRLSYEKALLYFLDVWEEINSRMPTMSFIIAGDGGHDYKVKLKKRIKQLKNPQSVLMTGAVTGDLKLALLQHSKCLVLPSYSESFGIVVIESLFSGKPVIASTKTPWNILEEECFGRWIPHEKTIWTDAILDLTKDDSYDGFEFLERARRWVIENYNWSRIADKYIDVYKNIIRPHLSEKTD